MESEENKAGDSVLSNEALKLAAISVGREISMFSLLASLFAVLGIGILVFAPQEDSTKILTFFASWINSMILYVKRDGAKVRLSNLLAKIK